jgi:hypothetical protein
MRFDRLTRTASAMFSRRGMASTLGLAAIALSGSAAAKKKRKKKKKITRNSFGCVDVGKFCKNAGQCCSGICQGKKGKKRCQAHDTGIVLNGGGGCTVAQDSCGAGADTFCTTSAGEEGRCFRTTGNAGYCIASGDCFPCTKDADCVPFCGPGAACIACDTSGTDCDTTCNGPGECTFPV